MPQSNVDVSQNDSKHECIQDTLCYSKFKQACDKVFKIAVKKVFEVFFASKV